MLTIIILIKQLDDSTRKLLALYKCFSVVCIKENWWSQIVLSGRCQCLSVSKHLACSDEPLLQQVFQCSFPPEFPSKLKAKRKQDHYDAWKSKPLHGPFIREIDGCIDMWKWLSNSNLKKETKGLIMAAQNQAIKVNIFHQPSSPMSHRICRYDGIARLIHHSLENFLLTINGGFTSPYLCWRTPQWKFCGTLPSRLTDTYPIIDQLSYFMIITTKSYVFF